MRQFQSTIILCQLASLHPYVYIFTPQHCPIVVIIYFLIVKGISCRMAAFSPTPYCLLADLIHSDCSSNMAG